MFEILDYLPGKRKKTAKGWICFSAVCCHHRGHKPDRRMRGAIIQNDNNFTYKCFNCHFKCTYTLGRTLTKNTKQFLSWLGLDDGDIARINIESLQHKDFVDYAKPSKKKVIDVEFPEKEAPEGQLIDPNNPLHKRAVDYLKTRKFNPHDYPFLTTPGMPGRYGNRVIIPFTHKGKIVGSTSRFLDGHKPKYLNDQPSGYLFGYDFQQSDWTTCIVVEGIFDALSIDACALGTNTISREQRELLRSLNRTIIVVPDQDESGLELIDQALEYGYLISLPEWGNGKYNKPIKDVNEAVIKYGRLPVLLSILETATRSKILIELARRKIAKGI